MKDSTAYMITDMMKDVIKNGSGTLAQISGLHQAGKTGTTDYSSEELAKSGLSSDLAKDSWFAGYTKHYSITVWTGYDKPLENGLTMEERNIAAYIYRAMMVYLSQNVSNTDWTMPSSVQAKTIAGVRELFVKGTTAAISDASTSSSYSSTHSVIETPTPSISVQSSSQSVPSSESSESVSSSSVESSSSVSSTPSESSSTVSSSSEAPASSSSTPATSQSTSQPSISTQTTSH